MERGFSLLAGDDPQALIRRTVRRASMIALVVAMMASAADAKPRRRDAKAAYDRGVTHYQLRNFQAAVDVLSKSFELERDVDTAFAWAQAERMLNHCDRAIDLYEKALSFKMPPENRLAIEQNLAECKVILAQQKPATPPPVEPPVEPPPVIAKPPASPPKPPEPAEPAAVVAERENPLPAPPPPVDAAPPSSAWYKDPVALGLLGTGLVAGGVGAGLVISSRSLGDDVPTAPSYADAQDLDDKSRSRLQIGRITAGAGAALVVGGVVWMVLRPRDTEKPAVTGWLTPDGAGVAVAGGF